MTHNPLAIYIHWPFCKSKCPYCDFNSHVRDAVDQESWRDALLAELAYMASHVQDREVASIFFGGGTPSLMPPSTAQALIDRVAALWPVAGNVEITLEANPTSVETHTFPDFARAGVNRVSLGVQSLRQKELTFLGRGHNVGEALAAIELARKTFRRYSFDLIYARPNQTVQEWEAELGEALRYAGSHLSLYQLTIEPNTAFAHAYANGALTLPDEETSEQLYALTEQLAAAHGLAAYEVSNYAKPGEESRHNLAYWQGRDYIGIGPGAHGRIFKSPRCAPTGAHMGHSSGLARPADRDSFSRIATSTLKSPERWLEAVKRDGHGYETWETLPERTVAEERIMMGLRLAEGISYFECSRDYGIDLSAHINQRMRALYVRQGLLTDNPDRLQATRQGRLVLTRLTADLLS